LAQMRYIYCVWHYQLARLFSKTALPSFGNWKAGSILVLLQSLVAYSFICYSTFAFGRWILGDYAEVVLVSIVIAASLSHLFLVDRSSAYNDIVDEYQKLGARRKKWMAVLGWLVALAILANAVIATEMLRNTLGK